MGSSCCTHDDDDDEPVSNGQMYSIFGKLSWP